MKIATEIARKLALGGKGSGASRITGWIAILGMGIGGFALIISIAVMQGFESQVIDKIISFEGDMRATGDQVTVAIDHPAVTMVLPFMERKGLIQNQAGEKRLVQLKGVDIHQVLQFYPLDWTEIDTSLMPTYIFVGNTLARRLQLQVGDKLNLLSPIDSRDIFGLPKIITAVIGGIFQAEVLQFDDDFVFIPLSAAKQLFQRKSTIDGIDIRLQAGSDTERVRNELAARWPELEFVTWSDMHETLLSAMRMERIGALVVLSLIIIVAAFNLATTLVLVASQKRQELGMLRAMGASHQLIYQIIFRQGILIGGSGALIGILAGTVLVVLQQVFQLISLPSDIYFTSSLPVEITVPMFVTIVLIAAGSILFTADLVARRIRKNDPLNALFAEK